MSVNFLCYFYCTCYVVELYKLEVWNLVMNLVLRLANFITGLLVSLLNLKQGLLFLHKILILTIWLCWVQITFTIFWINNILIRIYLLIQHSILIQRTFIYPSTPKPVNSINPLPIKNLLTFHKWCIQYQELYLKLRCLLTYLHFYILWIIMSKY